MCLRSGWLEALKVSIDRVLTHHPLDGVYYDWNVALLCCNPRHEKLKPGQSEAHPTTAPGVRPSSGAASWAAEEARGSSGLLRRRTDVAAPEDGRSLEAAVGHWDIDELLNLMEWTRRRVGPHGLVIVHNTTTPMFATENFADHVVANEWGYGKWSALGPNLEQLPLEWSLVGARSRGVISYGQLDAQSPRHLHRLFALEALLAGVTPWPASPETFDVFSVLSAIGPLESCRFADWRNPAVTIRSTRAAAAVYSRSGESWLVLGNLDQATQAVGCVLHPDKLPYPLSSVTAATLLPSSNASANVSGKPTPLSLDVNQLLSGPRDTLHHQEGCLLPLPFQRGEGRGEGSLRVAYPAAPSVTNDGVTLTIPPETAVLLHVR